MLEYIHGGCHGYLIQLSASQLAKLELKPTNPVSSLGVRETVTKRTGSEAEKFCGNIIVDVSLRMARHCVRQGQESAAN